ncbi:Uncharacterised protein [Achromobacter xylosoxidans]|nr:Uncharacterised protein [Achromobacter xylosoxidans]
MPRQPHIAAVHPIRQRRQRHPLAARQRLQVAHGLAVPEHVLVHAEQLRTHHHLGTRLAHRARLDPVQGPRSARARERHARAIGLPGHRDIARARILPHQPQPARVQLLAHRLHARAHRVHLVVDRHDAAVDHPQRVGHVALARRLSPAVRPHRRHRERRALHGPVRPHACAAAQCVRQRLVGRSRRVADTADHRLALADPGKLGVGRVGRALRGGRRALRRLRALLRLHGGALRCVRRPLRLVGVTLRMLRVAGHALQLAHVDGVRAGLARCQVADAIGRRPITRRAEEAGIPVPLEAVATQVTHILRQHGQIVAQGRGSGIDANHVGVNARQCGRHGVH